MTRITKPNEIKEVQKHKFKNSRLASQDWEREQKEKEEWFSWFF